jgi:hypothetical protein
MRAILLAISDGFFATMPIDIQVVSLCRNRFTVFQTKNSDQTMSVSRNR